MGSVIIKPKKAVRSVLSDPTNRMYLSTDILIKVDEILAKTDDDWTMKDFHFCWRQVAEVEDAS